MFTWIREDPEALVIWVDSVDEKEMLLASDPDVFFTTDHYDGYPVLLVNLETLERDEAEELITESWRMWAPKKAVEEFDATNG
jgi:hypothetical protein